MSSNIEYVVLVDSDDRVLGQAEKLEAHRQGLLHRAFSVFLFRHKAGVVELLLQRRALTKYHAPGLWTNTCCSHPRLNEDVTAAGERRLFEEMGMRAWLQPVGRFQYRAELANGLIEHELDYLLLAWSEGEAFSLNSEEVMEARWVELEQIKNDYRENPQKFTPWFKEAFDLVIKDLPQGSARV
jgi:isopentenyl-diphosphate delta-isomerase type 1